MSMNVDVAIVGFGPVGATLANLLVQQGVSVAVLERESDVYHLARAGHLDAEVMRVLQGIGIADALEPQTGQTKGMRFVDAGGKLLMEWKRGGERGPSGWVSDYMFYQPTLETLLRDRLKGAEGFHQLLLHDVYAIEPDTGGVTVRAEDTVDDRIVSVRARYVVGCDGARSLVRRVIGTDHVDLGFRQRWLVVNVQAHEDPGFEPVSIQHCNPTRPGYATSSGQRLRWEFMVHDGESARELMRHDNVWNLIESSVQPISRSQGEITRLAVYTFESLIARSWRAGRLLIAGDAAHRMPPFLGQGMCAGMRDASNLAWKLAAVIEGSAGDALLDTYASERAPHVTEFTRGAIEAGRFVQLSDPAQVDARIRDMRDNPRQYAPPNPYLGPGLSLQHGSHGIGRQFVQPAIAGRRLDDIVGHRFAVVARPGFLTGSIAPSALATKWPALQAIELSRDREAALAPYDAPAIVIRPDRYVHAAAKDASRLLAVLAGLSDLLGAPSPGPVDSWTEAGAGPGTPTAHDEAMLRAYGFDRAVDYGMSLDDVMLLDKRVRGGADWMQVLQRLGEDELIRATLQSTRNHAASASAFYLHAAACFRLAQAGSEDDEARRVALYERQVEAFSRGVTLSGYDATPLEFIHRGAPHRGWLVRPPRATASCVLVWGGADGWCEAFWRSVPAFLERGMAVCLTELPGQGLARLRQGSYLDGAFTTMVSAAIDQLCALDFAPQRFGVVGHSMGGTLAMAAAAADPRIIACVSNGGNLERRAGDQYPRATRRMERMLGPGGDAGAFFASLDLPARLPSMPAKLLCVQGGRDVLVPDEQAHRIVALRGEGHATLAYWPGGVHCIYNHAVERNALIADWLAQALDRDPPRSGNP
jgi:3-(3-hydroxy-phenyl)propionate hydroxylase